MLNNLVTCVNKYLQSKICYICTINWIFIRCYMWIILFAGCDILLDRLKKYCLFRWRKLPRDFQLIHENWEKCILGWPKSVYLVDPFSPNIRCSAVQSVTVRNWNICWTERNRSGEQKRRKNEKKLLSEKKVIKEHKKNKYEIISLSHNCCG